MRQSPHLAPETVARARALRREMTPAERALRAGLRRAFPGVHFRYQVPIGSYYADVACHGAKLIVEVDGAQHGFDRNALLDQERDRWFASQGYRVLRFWNNQVLNELDAVLTVIATQLPSRLVGEGGAKRRMGGADRRSARATGAHPLPSPPRKGEGENDNLSVGVN